MYAVSQTSYVTDNTSLHLGRVINFGMARMPLSRLCQSFIEIMTRSVSHSFNSVIFTTYLTQRRVDIFRAMFRKEKSAVLGVETGMCVFTKLKFHTAKFGQKIHKEE